jgi:hypothetical protein
LTAITYVAYAVLGLSFAYLLVSFYVVALPLSSLFLVLIRWTHFVGAFTAVGAIFTALLIVTPVLKTLSGEIKTVAVNRFVPALLAVHVFALDLTMGGGLALAWFLSGGNLLAFVTTRWGITVLVAGILTIVTQFNAERAMRKSGFTLNIHGLSPVQTLLQNPSANGGGSSNPPSISYEKLTGVIRTNFVLALTIMFLMGFAAHGAL